MRNCYLSSFRSVFEIVMIASDTNKIPTVLFQNLDDFHAAVALDANRPLPLKADKAIITLVQTRVNYCGRLFPKRIQDMRNSTFPD